MKKLLGILVLGLLVCNTASAKSIFDYIKIGDSKKQVKKYLYPWGWSTKYSKTDEMKNLADPKAYGLCHFAGMLGLNPSGISPLNKYFPEYKTRRSWIEIECNCSECIYAERI